MTYGSQVISEEQSQAIVDTGSSQLSVPPKVFDQMSAKWRETIPNLVCKPSKTFCFVEEPCESVVQKIQPIGFQLSDYVFELTPEEYLFKARKNTCFFVIHKTGTEGSDSNMYMLGDLFLQHFYSVYDMDRDEVSLGINSHSKDKVHMYEPGNRPESLEQQSS